MNMKFEDMEFDEVFDGVWACASLLHVKKENIENTLAKVIKSMKEDGTLYMSFKYGDFEGIRDSRYYSDYKTNEIKDIIKNFDDLEIVDIFTSKRKQDMIEWINVYCKKISEDKG